MTAPNELRLGVWKIAQWNWAYRFVLPDGHRYAGSCVYGCGFSTRERAEEAMAWAKATR